MSKYMFNINQMETVFNDPLIERAFLCIEDNDYDKADELLESVLNKNPKCVHAYLGKLFITYKTNSITQMIDKLVELNVTLDEDKNYQKLIRFASNDEKLNYEIDVLDWPKEKIYREAEIAYNTNDFTTASELYKKIEDYKVARKLLNDCYKHIYNINYYIKETMYRIAYDIFRTKQIAEEESMIIYEEEKNSILQKINDITAAWNMEKLPYESLVADVEKDISDHRNRLDSLGVFAFKKKKEIIEDIELLDLTLKNEIHKLSDINNIYTERISILEDRIKYLDNNKNNRFSKERSAVLNLDDQEVKAVLVELYKGGKHNKIDLAIKLRHVVHSTSQVLQYFESKMIIIGEKYEYKYNHFNRNKVDTRTSYLININYLNLPFEYGAIKEDPDVLLQKWNEYCRYRKEKKAEQENNKNIKSLYKRALDVADEGKYLTAIKLMVKLEVEYSIYSNSSELIDKWWNIYKTEKNQSTKEI